MIDYMEALFESISLVQEHLVIRTEKNYSRTIFIDDCGIDATDFDIEREMRGTTASSTRDTRPPRNSSNPRTSWSKFFTALKERFGWKDSTVLP
jgi:hypothetical protein